MAEHSKTHLWLNTIIACLALAASAGSSFVAWRSYQLRTESLGFVSRFTSDCKVEYDGGALGLCWVLTITNLSDSRTSIVGAQTFSLEHDSLVLRSGFTTIETEKGEDALAVSAIVLDGGEARSYIVRIPFGVIEEFGKVMDGVIKPANGFPMRIRDLEDKLGLSSVELIGTKIAGPMGDIGTLKPRAIGQISLTTGREHSFTARVVYPPESADIVPGAVKSSNRLPQ